MHGNSRHGNSMHGNSVHGSRHGYHNSGHRRDMEMGFKNSSHKPRTPTPSYDEDEDSLSGHSFGGDDGFYDEKTPSGRSVGDDSFRKPPPRRRSDSQKDKVHFARVPSQLPRTTSSGDALGSSNHSYGGAGQRVRLPGEVKQNRLLRTRRVLRENKQKEAKDLYYHFIGTILNVGFAVMALIFIITIASTVSNRNIFFFKRRRRIDSPVVPCLTHSLCHSYFCIQSHREVFVSMATRSISFPSINLACAIDAPQKEVKNVRYALTKGTNATFLTTRAVQLHVAYIEYQMLQIAWSFL